MNKDDIKKFFNDKASIWDDMDETDPAIVNTILDNADITENCRVLDVACGTGVMIPFYLCRGIKDITAIDISDEMIKRAEHKFGDRGIRFICGDVESEDFERCFNRIIVYNAFPHFPEPERMVVHLCSLLDKGGVITIAHGKSREEIDSHHKGEAAHISNGLMPVEELVGLLPEYMKETVRVSDNKMYQLAAIKI